MRYLGLTAAALLVLAPAAASASSWQLATATTVMAGVGGHSTFVVQAYVALPQSCYTTRVTVYHVTADLNRAFMVQQKATSGCSGSTYHCVASATFRLPIQHKFDVHTAGKTWRVTLGASVPAPTQPLCKT